MSIDNRGRWPTKRRSVVLFGGAPPKGRTVLFAFGYADLAMWLGVTVGTIRNLVSEGKLDPTSFDSIVEYARTRGKSI